MISFIDITLPVLVIAAAYIGRNRGAIKQTGSLIGIFVGSLVGASIYSLLAHLTESSLVRTIILALIILAVSFLSYDVFTAIGNRLQKKTQFKAFIASIYNKIGSAFASGVIAFLVVWLFVLLFGTVMPSPVRLAIKDSEILSLAAQYAKPPQVITNISQLLQPFGSPDVFASNEPTFDTSSLPVTQRYERLDQSLNKAKESVAKVTTWGCGSIGSGSGFMIDKNLIMTNAHVVVGVDRISVENGGNSYVAQPVFFDPQLDIAILRTASPLAGTPLTNTATNLAVGTIGGILGYPNGGDLTTSDVVVLQDIHAEGYDIYQANKVKRHIYVVRSTIIPGDSGGPLIDADGNLAGVIIGHSTNDGRIGFIVTIDQLSGVIKKAHDLHDIVSNGSCAGA